ncbi:MAG TPA: peptide chain release factor N(5)-glutamine methyltransferase [Candidatus Eisenbacteria bacterium]|nr:peptide chain release factor N(5)-glutamine methyltransferase [Candidatus Eisenbacteria bacterium]
MTRAEALERLRTRLRAAGIQPANQEAEWLLAHALETSVSALWKDKTALLDPTQEDALEALTRRRERREPLQLILGEMPFHHVTLQVEPGVFIPRPETEELVEAVLEALGGDVVDRGRAPDPRRLLDLGTGTGAIAIALLHALPGWQGVAVDRSPLAVALAARNAHRNGVGERLRTMIGDFTSPASAPWEPDGPFDLVVSNPPYIRRGDIPGLMPEVRDHDPVEALDGGPDGLDALRQLAARLTAWLRPGGHLALEIGADQADTVLGILSPHIQDARILPDRAGFPRIAIGIQRSGDA